MGRAAARMPQGKQESPHSPQQTLPGVRRNQPYPNVGNLVCPAGFDLGESARVVILSVTEGDGKPLKYPNMFAAADLMVISKTDLLAHVGFEVDRVVERARRLNPALQCLALSACDGTGMAAWLDWIRARADRQGADARVAVQPTDPLFPARA